MERVEVAVSLVWAPGALAPILNLGVREDPAYYRMRN